MKNILGQKMANMTGTFSEQVSFGFVKSVTNQLTIDTRAQEVNRAEGRAAPFLLKEDPNTDKAVGR